MSPLVSRLVEEAAALRVAQELAAGRPGAAGGEAPHAFFEKALAAFAGSRIVVRLYEAYLAAMGRRLGDVLSQRERELFSSIVSRQREPVRLDGLAREAPAVARALVAYLQAYEYALGRTGLCPEAEGLWASYCRLLLAFQGTYGLAQYTKEVLLSVLRRVPFEGGSLAPEFRAYFPDLSDARPPDAKQIVSLQEAAVSFCAGFTPEALTANAGRAERDPLARGPEASGPPLSSPEAGPVLAQAYANFAALFDAEAELGRALHLGERLVARRLLMRYEQALFYLGRFLPGLYVDVAFRVSHGQVTNDPFTEIAKDSFRKVATARNPDLARLLPAATPALKREFTDSTDLAFSILQRGAAEHPRFPPIYDAMAQILKSKGKPGFANLVYAELAEEVLGTGGAGPAPSGGRLPPTPAEILSASVFIAAHLAKSRGLGDLAKALARLVEMQPAGKFYRRSFWVALVRVLERSLSPGAFLAILAQPGLAETAHASAESAVAAVGDPEGSGGDLGAQGTNMLSRILRDVGADGELLSVLWAAASEAEKARATGSEEGPGSGSAGGAGEAGGASDAPANADANGDANPAANAAADSSADSSADSAADSAAAEVVTKAPAGDLLSADHSPRDGDPQVEAEGSTGPSGPAGSGGAVGGQKSHAGAPFSRNSQRVPRGVSHGILRVALKAHFEQVCLRAAVCSLMREIHRYGNEVFIGEATRPISEPGADLAIRDDTLVFSLPQPVWGEIWEYVCGESARLYAEAVAVLLPGASSSAPALQRPAFPRFLGDSALRSVLDGMLGDLLATCEYGAAAKLQVFRRSVLDPRLRPLALSGGIGEIAVGEAWPLECSTEAGDFKPPLVSNLRVVISLESAFLDPLFPHGEAPWTRAFVYAPPAAAWGPASREASYGSDPLRAELELFCARHGEDPSFLLPSTLQTRSELDSFGRFGGAMEPRGSEAPPRPYAPPVDYRQLPAVGQADCCGLAPLGPLDAGFPLAATCSNKQLLILSQDHGFYNPFARRVVLPEGVEPVRDEQFRAALGLPARASGRVGKPDAPLLYQGVSYSRSNVSETLRRIRTLRMPLNTPAPLSAFVEKLLPILEPPNQEPVRWNPDVEEAEAICSLALRYTGGDSAALPPAVVVEPVRENQIRYPE